MSPAWQLRTIPLKFRIGDWTVLSVPLRLYARSLRLADRAVAEANPRPPPDSPPSDASGYMVRALPVVSELPTLTVGEGFIRYVTLQYGHCFIDLSIGMEAYRQKFSAKTRSTIARKIRKFQEHCAGELKWSSYKTPEAMTEFHRLARQVSVRTYQERLLDAGIPDDPAFIDEMTRLAQRDEVRAYILFHGDAPVSYLYCPVQDGTLIYAYLGYDPEYMKLSVGTVLQWLALEQLFDEARFDFFDFTEGQSEHKRLFATHEVPCANIIFLQHSTWRAALVRAHAASDRLSAAAGRLAERWGVKSRLRRLLRFGLAGSK